MKISSLKLTVAAIFGLTLAACGTELKTLPLQPVIAASKANVTADANVAPDVALYFGAQPHADIARRIGDTSHSIRIARATDDAGTACNKALADGIDKLRADARKQGANAVINVTTRFHGSQSESTTEYNCGVSRSAASIVVKGDLVVLQAN